MKSFLRSILIVSVVLLTCAFAANAQTAPVNKRTLIVFHSELCSSCVLTKERVMPGIEKEFKDKINFDYRETSENLDNYKLLISLKEKYHFNLGDDLPVFYAEGQFINGENDLENRLRGFINKLIASPVKEEGAVESVDLVQHFKSFTFWAIIGVGLIDGLNPCAITVIVFFMSFLAFRGYRKREIAVIGLIFIGSVYLTYVLIGIGIFGFLYQMQGFWLISKIVNITVGLISILFSGYAIYDFIQFRKSNSTDEMFLHLPKSVRDLIHKVIRTQYKKEDPKVSEENKNLFGLAVTALITGFLVSVLEAVCVVKIYLPTIVFVLKTTQMKGLALAYLLVYNLLFILPLLIIFGFALAGTTSEKFAKLLKGNLGAIKILMALMFLFLGIILLWRA
ncbi:MAG: hypothetical protein HQL26_06500 [Candidatus Omnitrophica bacterium]|nr:hypothetical protein [Candidatus Omnitrophota bacterium]